MATLRQGGKTAPPRTAAMFIVNEKDRAWVDSLLVPQPIATMTQRLVMTGARDRVPRKAYIRPTGYENAVFDRYYAKRTLVGEPSTSKA